MTGMTPVKGLERTRFRCPETGNRAERIRPLVRDRSLMRVVIWPEPRREHLGVAVAFVFPVAWPNSDHGPRDRIDPSVFDLVNEVVASKVTALKLARRHDKPAILWAIVGIQNTLGQKLGAGWNSLNLSLNRNATSDTP